jgi:hypothetical protein
MSPETTTPDRIDTRATESADLTPGEIKAWIKRMLTIFRGKPHITAGDLAVVRRLLQDAVKELESLQASRREVAPDGK